MEAAVEKEPVWGRQVQRQEGEEGWGKEGMNPHLSFGNMSPTPRSEGKCTGRKCHT